MERRTFLKTLIALGVSVALPTPLATASDEEVEQAYQTLRSIYGLYEVSEYGTLSDADFEAPRTRREAYGYTRADLDIHILDAHWYLRQPVVDRYRAVLEEEARAAAAYYAAHPDEDEFYEEDLEEADLDDLAEEGWPDWFAGASAAERAPFEACFEEWLDEPLDDEDIEHLYRTATAQGAAYIRWVCEEEEVLEALGIVIIEGDCPGSSYLGAELRIPIAAANRIAAARGWGVRFIAEGSVEAS